MVQTIGAAHISGAPGTAFVHAHFDKQSSWGGRQRFDRLTAHEPFVFGGLIPRGLFSFYPPGRHARQPKSPTV